ncbi:unnamed protein product, partial [Discosporangium mesarthrocarpum]
MPRPAIDVVGSAGALAQAGEGKEATLWPDRPCCCIRVRGKPSDVAESVSAIKSALSAWEELEVSVPIEAWMAPLLVGKKGKGIRQLSEDIGIHLCVDQDLRQLWGRASSPRKAMEAKRQLQRKVDDLRGKRIEVHIPLDSVPQLI